MANIKLENEKTMKWRTKTLLFLLIYVNLGLSAQFHTVSNNRGLIRKMYFTASQNPVDKKDSIVNEVANTLLEEQSDRRETMAEMPALTHRAHLSSGPDFAPADVGGDLTIRALYDEILKCGLAHPEIVMCQAMLETGWLRSNVCRYKNNLFGLTNPRTGKYYEFADWRDSVKAYYTKVQYRYKGGNYLLWLKEIGYAEDPGYIKKLMVLLDRHFIKPVNKIQ